MADTDLANQKNLFSRTLETLYSIDIDQFASGEDSSVDTANQDDRKRTTFTGAPVRAFKEALEIFEGAVESLLKEDFVPEYDAVALNSLAVCLDQALKMNWEACKSLTELLADASREPKWRKPFATAVQHTYHYRSIPNPEQAPNTVLLVALGILARTSECTSEDVLRNALRLINNCCSDDDTIRQTVVDNNGLSQLMNLAKQRIEPDFVVSALFNVCNDYDPAISALTLWEPQHHSAATESDGDVRAEIRVSGRGNPYWETHSTERTILVLLGLVDVLCHQDRKPLLAELIEIASRSATQNIDSSELSGFNNQHRELVGLLNELLCGPGLRLAAFDSDCRVAVAITLINVLSNDAAIKSLITGDLVLPFIGLLHPKTPVPSGIISKTGEDDETEANLSQYRQAMLKMLYSICALPEFTLSYPLNAELTSQCISSLRRPHSQDVAHNEAGLPLSAACVILASLTQSEDIARSLVKIHNVHEYLSVLLLENNDSDVLYPAVNFAGRLALPNSNKATLVQFGLLGAMHGFFDQDTTPSIQREAVIAVRRLTTGSAETLLVIGVNSPKNSLDTTRERSELAAILALFRRSDDTQLKMEVGRLAIEVCRILWAINNGQPDLSEDDFNQAIGPYKPEFAEAIAFVILHGEGPGARGEGWFGFAMMSVWRSGRASIINTLNSQDMLDEVKKVAALGGGPGYQNLRLVLAKLNAISENDILPNVQAVLERVAKEMGLGSIWSK